MNELLKELLPNPTFVDYQVPHTGQGADFYDTHRMLEYGRRIVQECLGVARSYPSQQPDYAAGIDSVRDQIAKHFGVGS